MNDEELTDIAHGDFSERDNFFLPDNLIFSTEPDPKTPKCTFDLWCMAFLVEGQAEAHGIMTQGLFPVTECESETWISMAGRAFLKSSTNRMAGHDYR